MRAAILVTLLLAMSAGAHAESDSVIRLDGVFDDWQKSDVVATDPIGDASGAFDLSRVSARVFGTTVYLRFDTQSSINLQSGPESDGTLRLRFAMNGQRRLDIDFRNRQALLTTKGSANSVPWQDISFASLPTYATDDFELRVELGSVGARAGDKIEISFEGSDALKAPIALQLGGEDAATVKLSEPEDAAATFRIATLNTFRQGTASPRRAPWIKKLFDFADADIYCLNEELEEPLFRKHCFDVITNMPADDEAIHWAATCGIVSRYPLTPLAFQCAEAAALIDIPGDGHLIVVSAHFKCCGYSGSQEDDRRVSEVNELLSDLKRVREGEFGGEAAAASVIVLGDFNLVGSRKPLDLLNEAGLADVMLRCPVDRSAMTWRGLRPTESFWPGRLDYVTIKGERLTPIGGFILNSEQLAKLEGSETEGVAASDHSMLVVDVKTR